MFNALSVEGLHLCPGDVGPRCGPRDIEDTPSGLEEHTSLVNLECSLLQLATYWTGTPSGEG